MPFRPLPFYVIDGSTYDVHHPDLCVVGLGSVILVLSEDPAATYFERTIRVDRRHVTRIEPLSPNPVAAVGDT